MSRLPRDIKSSIILQLPMRDVQALCQTNKDYYNFCNSNPGFWKGIIERDFGNVFGSWGKLQDKLESIFRCDESMCWNYKTYTHLIRYLTPITQLRVYLNMNDMDSFYSNEFSPDQRYIAALLNGRVDLMDMKSVRRNYRPMSGRIKDYLLGTGDKSVETVRRVFTSAAARNYPEIVEILLEDPMLPRSYVKSTLTFARFKNFSEIVKVLEQWLATH